MLKTIRPYGAISEHLVQYIGMDQHGRTCVVDSAGNVFGIEETEFEKLKGHYKEVQVCAKVNQN